PELLEHAVVGTDPAVPGRTPPALARPPPDQPPGAASHRPGSHRGASRPTGEEPVGFMTLRTLRQLGIVMQPGFLDLLREEPGGQVPMGCHTVLISQKSPMA